MPNAPALVPTREDPCACAASSTSQTPLRAARETSSGIRPETTPPMCTTIAPAVRGVSRRSSSSGAVPNESGSVSISTGRAPAWTTAAAVAKNVFAGTRTSRPATSSERRMISSAAVPLLTATAWRTPQ